MTPPPTTPDRILQRIGVATRAAGEVAQSSTPPSRATTSCTAPQSPGARLALLIERLREYDAEVAETTPAALPAAIAQQLTPPAANRSSSPRPACPKNGSPPASNGRWTAS